MNICDYDRNEVQNLEPADLDLLLSKMIRRRNTEEFRPSRDWNSAMEVARELFGRWSFQDRTYRLQFYSHLESWVLWDADPEDIADRMGDPGPRTTSQCVDQRAHSHVTFVQIVKHGPLHVARALAVTELDRLALKKSEHETSQKLETGVPA